MTEAWWLCTALVFGVFLTTTASDAGSVAGMQVGFTRGPSIFLASSDGTHQRLVLRGSGNTSYFEPAWSNSGRLAVTRSVYGQGGSAHSDSDVLLIRPGRAPLVLFKEIGGTQKGSPAWAPDSARISLVGDRGMFGGSLYVGRLGGQAKSLEPSRCCYADDEPAWSRDGKTIAFSRGRFSPPPVSDYLGSQLFVIRPDGTGLKRLSKVSAHHPAWAPDSRRIVFDDDHRIRVINSDGSGLRTLYFARAGYAADPAWSPDGRLIAFVRDDPVHGDAVWVMGASGANAHLLIPKATDPAWKTR